VPGTGLRTIAFVQQVDLPLVYKGLKLDYGYRIDLIVAERIIVELRLFKICAGTPGATHNVLAIDWSSCRVTYQFQCSRAQEWDSPKIL